MTKQDVEIIMQDFRAYCDKMTGKVNVNFRYYGMEQQRQQQVRISHVHKLYHAKYLFDTTGSSPFTSKTGK